MIPLFIIVSYRTSALKYIDEIFVMDNGKIVAKGSHEELLRKCKLYKEIMAKHVIRK